ncbi:MAG: hypothetical protein WCC48_10270, partial [Anaeromyxobacteraceae bacterium]
VPLLGAIDRPVSTDDWRGLPPGAGAVLEALAARPDTRPMWRARALEGLAILGTDGALHARLAADAATPFVVRFAALSALPAVLPAEKAQLTLGALLASDPDRRVRAAAADALARTAPAHGCGAIRAQAAREGTEGRFAFRHALTACGDR